MEVIFEIAFLIAVFIIGFSITRYAFRLGKIHAEKHHNIKCIKEDIRKLVELNEELRNGK